MPSSPRSHPSISAPPTTGRAAARSPIGLVVALLLLAGVTFGVVAAAGPATPAEAEPAVGAPAATAQVLAAALTWPAVGDPAVTGYKIGVSPGGAVVDVPVPVGAWTVQGLTAGTAYTFTVRSVTATGIGEPSSTSNAVVPTAPGGAFRPLVPARILDTRDGVGAPKAKVGPKATLAVPVLGKGGIPPAGVEAVVLNVTGVGASAPTHLTIFPTGSTMPVASSLNLSGPAPVPNLVEVKVGSGGAVSVFNNSGTIDVIFDVAGYVLAPSASVGTEGLFTPLDPARILDTREGIGAPKAKVGQDAAIPLVVAGQGGVPATGVGAVVLNVTTTNVSADTYVTAYPGDAPRPETSNLNVRAGATVPNRVVVKVGADGKVNLFNRWGTTDLIADVSGWYANAAAPITSGASFTGTDPARVLDTREAIGGPDAPVQAGVGRRVQIAGVGGVPPMGGPIAPTAVVANITVTAPTDGTFLVAWPHQTPKPLASDLNFGPGQTVPNLAVVKLSGDGAIAIDLGRGSADVIVDVLGWYAGDVTTAWNLKVVPPSSIAAAPDGSVTFSAPVPGLAVGSIVAAGVGPATPGGLLRRVTALNGATVTTVEAELPEAFVNAKLSTGQIDEATPATFPDGGGSGAGGAEGIGGSSAAFLGVEKSVTHALPGGGIGLSGQLESKFRIGLDLEVKTGPGGFDISADAGISITSSLTANLGVNVSGALSDSFDLPSTRTTPMLFFVGGVPVVVRIRLDPTFDVSVTGKLQLGTSVSISRTAKASIKYANGSVMPITSTSNEPPVFTKLTAKGNADLKTSLKVPVGLEINALARLSAGFAPYVRAHVDECRGESFVGVDGIIGFRLGAPKGDAKFQWSTAFKVWELKLTAVETGLCVDWSGTITLTEDRNLVTPTIGGGTHEIAEKKTYTWLLSGGCKRTNVREVTCPAVLKGRTTGTETGRTPTVCGEFEVPSTYVVKETWDSSTLTLPGAQVVFTEINTPGMHQFQVVWYIVNARSTFPATQTTTHCGKTGTSTADRTLSYDGTYPQLFPKLTLEPTAPIPTVIASSLGHTNAEAGYVGNAAFSLTSLPDDDHDGIPNP